jgi:hypothetical protein
MAVVINELEVAPQPPAQEPAGQKQQVSVSMPPETLTMVDKLLHVKQQRGHRLEAY